MNDRELRVMQEKIDALCEGFEALRSSHAAPALALEGVERRLDELGARLAAAAGSLGGARPQTHSVLLLARVLRGPSRGATAFRGEIGEQTFCWTHELLPGASVTQYADPYVPVGPGSWLVALNGGLLSNVIVGDCMVCVPFNGESRGPVCILNETIAMGMQLRYTLHAPER
jgi:hypothetical protein